MGARAGCLSILLLQGKPQEAARSKTEGVASAQIISQGLVLKGEQEGDRGSR
ncbi:mCG141056, partial [Mus musculus]